MGATAASFDVDVMVVARRVFLSERHRKALLGDAPLIPLLRMLDDTVVTAAQVTAKGPTGEVGVRVMEAPVERTRVELSLKDHVAIDASARMNLTCDLDDTDGCTLTGPAGTVVLADGVINASRRLELDEEQATAHGLSTNHRVAVQLRTERGRELSDVLVRVRPGPALLVLDIGEATSLNVNETTRARVLIGGDSSNR